MSLTAVPSWAEERTPVLEPSQAEQDPSQPPTTPSTGHQDLDTAKLKAAETGKRVEIPQRDTETTTLYANPDGKTLRMELHLQPIRVKNADGEGFTPIDTTLVEVDGVIKPKAAKGGLTLSTGGGTTVITSKGADATARIDAPGKLPNPVLNGSTATYPSAYGNGIDLVVTATPSGFRQQIVIRQRPAESVTFRVAMDLPKGLSFGENAKGWPTLKSGGGKRTLAIRPAALLDAVAADPYGDIDSGKVGKAAVTLDGSALAYRPDPDFLADPATAYPVTMVAADDDWWDCTLGDCPDGVGESMDTYINDVDLTDSWDTFARDQMWVGKSYASSIAKRWRGYVQFPMPREGDPFWGAKIQNADLELWNYLSNDCGEFVGSGITARRVTSDWDELTLLWSDQPSVTSLGADTEYGAYSTDCSGSMNYEHDLIHSVNAIVQAWADGEPNYGFRLTAGDESELRNWRRYRTREQTDGYPAHGPRLAVDFEPKPEPVMGTYLKSLGEPSPFTREDRDQWETAGRISNTLPEPDPVTNKEDLDYRAATDQEVNTPTDELQEPLPVPEYEVTARWPFSEGTGATATDASGNGHTAMVNGDVAWTPGVSNSALTNVGVTGGDGDGPATQSLLPARVAAARQAAARNAKVEVAEETTATSVTYAQPGGKSFVTEVMAGPVRVKRNGVWAPIDTTLIQQDGRLVPRAIAAGAAVELSAGGTDPFVKMSADGKSYALRWPTPLPKPTVKGSKATYTDAAGVGADLVVTALPTGFRHEVVLRQRPAKQVELRIGVEDEGLTLSEGKGGRLLLKGKDKRLVAAGTRPIVSDGSGKDRPASAKRGKAGTDVVTKGGRTELVVKPDQAFLADAGTAYPVRVAAVVTLPLSADVDTSMNDSEGWPALPDNPVMLAGTMTGGTKARVHLRFDTTGLQGSTVTDATLSMNTIDSHNCGAALANGIQVARLTGAWDPANLYWANKPAHTTEDASTNFKGVDQNCDTYPDSMDWNVTGIAQDWAAGAANHGLVLKSPGEANINNYRVFTSSEETDFNLPPKLTITTSGPASQPAVSTPAITPAHTVDGTTVTTSLTPQLAATVADTASGNLTGEFEVEHDPAATGQGSGQIWTGASPEVTSGTQATVSVPAGMLTDGWKIRWRARAANAAASSTSAWSDWQTATVDVPNPTVGPFQVTPSQVVEGVTVATSLTPALHTTVTDPAAQPVRAEFELEHDPAATGQGSGQIWTGAADGVASGTQASATVPDGVLIDGWKLRWRARAVNVTSTASSPWSEWQSLTIDVPAPVNDPSVGVLQITPSQQEDGTTVTTSLTPSLLAQTSNPIGGTLRVEFEVEHDPAATGQGSGQIWTGAADGVASGTQASATVPDGVLTDGWKVRWRARAVAGEVSSAWSDWQSVTVVLPKPGVHDLEVMPSTVVDGITMTSALTPTLKATVVDPQGRTLRAEFEVEHDPAATGQGSGQIWTGAADGVASGTQASATVPDGVLTDGWKLRWRARVVAGDQSSEWSAWQLVTVKVPQPGSEPFARTAAPVISTDQDFTVGAWLKFSDKDGSYTVMEQKGTYQAPFRLGNDPDRGLVFTFTNADAADATTEGVLSDVEPPVNEWFHLTGVYTQSPSTATLYLNGLEIGTSALGFAAWNAAAPLTLGTSMTGSLDEVWVYDLALISDEVFDLTDGSPTADGAAGTGAARSSTAAAATPRYDRLSPEDCWKYHGLKKRTYGYMKNRYGGCMIHEVSVFTGSIEVGTDGSRGNIRPDVDINGSAEWLGRMMLVARTWNGPKEIDAGATARDIWFDLYVGYRQRQFWEDGSSANLTIGMRPARGQSACKDVTTFNGGTQRNHLTMDVEDWVEKAEETDDGKWTPLATFRFRAASADAPASTQDRAGNSVSNSDKISNCVFKPYANIESTGRHAVLFQYGTTDEKAQITCDSSHSVGAWNGCTLPVLPSIEWKLDGTYDAAYKHYYKACYNSVDTYPKDSTKAIPGCAINRINRPPKEQYLWRVSDPVAKNTNARARARCHSLWPNFSTNGQECDEYPFASAGNRNKDSDADRNFSVCAMPGGPKESNFVAGKALRRFQKGNRLLYGQDFFNRFSTELQSLPSMDSLCWKSANSGSTYWNDKQKD